MSRLTVQVPEPVLAGAKRLAERERLSVEEYVTRLLADLVRLDDEWERRIRRGGQVSRERFLEILRKAPDTEPEAPDRIE